MLLETGNLEVTEGRKKTGVGVPNNMVIGPRLEG